MSVLLTLLQLVNFRETLRVKLIQQFAILSGLLLLPSSWVQVFLSSPFLEYLLRVDCTFDVRISWIHTVNISKHTVNPYKITYYVADIDKYIRV